MLAALEESGLADNTIVIYTSDHGENRGEHGMWWKNCMYDTAARVPLIVRWPGALEGRPAPQRRLLAGGPGADDRRHGGREDPGDWDGDSLLPYMDDARTHWKDLAVSEYYAHNIASGFAMIRQGSWKYVYHTRMDETHGPQRELYDLKDDPGEFTNLADRAEQQERIAAMHAALVKELGEDPEQTELRCRRDNAKGYGRGPRAGEHSGGSEIGESSGGHRPPYGRKAEHGRERRMAG